MDEEQNLRNIAQTLRYGNEQEHFNYWVRNLAYCFKTSTEKIMDLALVKQEKKAYTGEFYDYTEDL